MRKIENNLFIIRRIKLILVSIILCFSAGTYLSAQLSRISVDGASFITEDGEKIVFRGYSSSDPDKLEKDGKWNEEYFSQIKAWGANIVRFPIHPSAWRERGKEDYITLLNHGIELATKNELYVILDWHSIGNLKSELFFRSIYETSQKETFEFWQIMAETFGQNPTVAFFELFNEPTVQQGKLGTSSWSEWKAIMEECITIIRGFGAEAIPLVAGFNWAYDLTPVLNDPIDATGIGYVSHPYPQKRSKPWTPKWEEDWGKIADTYPVILTEIGFCEEGEKGAHIPVIDDGSYVPAILDYTNQKGISIVVWVFDTSWSPSLIEDWNYTPTKSGMMWKNALTGK